MLFQYEVKHDEIVQIMKQNLCNNHNIYKICY